MADKKPTSREQVKEIIAGIEGQITELFQSERYFDYLRTMSRFHNYSFRNTILIYSQMPNATHVAGFNKWKDQFGRHVKKGERGITILAPTPYKKKVEEMKLDPDTKAPMLDGNGDLIMEEKTVEIPMFRPVKVFDVSQTDGTPLPSLVNNIAGDVQHYEAFMEALRRASPVPIEFKPLEGGLDGYFRHTDQTIAIREGMSQVQTVCAAVHEITHAMLHNKEKERLAAASGREDAPQPKDRETEEVEAESVSYAVCQYYGIDTAANSIGYIATWSSGRDLKELKASLDTITRTANSLISDIDRHFAEICKEQGIDLTPQPDALEQFAADMVDFMHSTGTLDYRFTLAPREETISDLADEMRRGYFAGVRSTLEQVVDGTGLPDAKALLERMEEMSDQRDAGMVYQMSENPLATGDGDRCFIQAHEKAAWDTLTSREIIFVGTEARCAELTKGLNEGTITARRVRELDQETPDTPERFVQDLFQHMEGLHETGQIPNPYGSLDREQVREHYLESLRHGRFSGLYDLLHETAKSTDTLTIGSLRRRLDNLSDKWDAGLSYEITPHFLNSDIDRAVIEARRQAEDGFQFRETIFTGSTATCEELKRKLEEKSITTRAVRALAGEDWPEPQTPLAQVQEAPAAQPVPDEGLFLVNGTVYLHVQQTDTGINYTLYDKDTMRLKDGGQLDYKDPERTPEDPIASASHIVCAMSGIIVSEIEPVPLDMLDALQEAQLQAPAPLAPHYAELVEHFAKEDAPLWDTTLDEYPLPDDSMTAGDLEAAGYQDGDLLPVSQGIARSMIFEDITVYAIAHGEAEIVFDSTDLENYPADVVFAIPRDEWEAGRDFRYAVEDRLYHQEEREAAFLGHGGDCFAIYQLRDGDETRDLRYMPLPGQGVDKQFYELVYTGALTSQDAGRDMPTTLENLFQRFNVDHPADYRRPSMSVSDIVALKQDGVLTCHYVDRYAFTELHGFLPQDNPLKNAEMAMEDDYNMIDGVINNGPKEGPSVAELEAQVKAGQMISLQNGVPARSQDLVGEGGARERTQFSPQAETELSGLCDDAASAVQREHGEKKSVRQKLKSKQARTGQKRTAPKKDAERGR